MAGRDSQAHKRAAAFLEEAARRHEWAAQYWEDHGNAGLAARERRFANNDRSTADVERSLARHETEAPAQRS